jgi:hypothetical protein
MKLLNDDETMSVGELIEKLRQYPKDMPVIITWEGQRVAISCDDDPNWRRNPFQIKEIWDRIQGVDTNLGEMLVINAEGDTF